MRWMEAGIYDRKGAIKSPLFSEEISGTNVRLNLYITEIIREPGHWIGIITEKTDSNRCRRDFGSVHPRFGRCRYCGKKQRMLCLVGLRK